LAGVDVPAELEVIAVQAHDSIFAGVELPPRIVMHIGHCNE
jgi:hypothetical protein